MRAEQRPTDSDREPEQCNDADGRGCNELLPTHRAFVCPLIFSTLHTAVADRTGRLPQNRLQNRPRVSAPCTRESSLSRKTIPSPALKHAKHAEDAFHLISLQTLRFVAASRSAKRMAADDSSAAAALHHNHAYPEPTCSGCLLDAALV